jgi:hypothetical protein
METMTTIEQIAAIQIERDDARQDLRDPLADVNEKVGQAESEMLRQRVFISWNSPLESPNSPRQRLLLHICGSGESRFSARDDRCARRARTHRQGACPSHRRGAAAGRIVEAEAYRRPRVLAAYNARGLTKRTTAMYGTGGLAIEEGGALKEPGSVTRRQVQELAGSVMAHIQARRVERRGICAIVYW